VLARLPASWHVGRREQRDDGRAAIFYTDPRGTVQQVVEAFAALEQDFEETG
jgi:hypothetical protein